METRILNDTFNKLSDPAISPQYGYGAEFSSDSVYLAVAAASSSPNIVIYKRSGDTFSLIQQLTLNATTNNNHCAWSKDGKYIVFVSEASPYIKIFKRSEDTFSEVTNPSQLPAGRAFGCAFYPRAFENS